MKIITFALQIIVLTAIATSMARAELIETPPEDANVTELIVEASPEDLNDTESLLIEDTTE